MAAISFSNRTSAIKLTRPTIARQGSAAAMDTFAAAALQLLEKKLQRGVRRVDSSGTSGSANTNKRPEELDALDLPIYSRRDGDDTLFSKLDEVGDQRVTVAQLLDRLKLTSTLFQAREYYDSNLNKLDYNVRQILAPRAVFEYLVARAYFVQELESSDSIFNYLTASNGGWKFIYDYIILKSFWDLKEQRKIALPNNTVDNQIIVRLTQNPVSLAQATFVPKLNSLLKEFVYDSDKLKLIRAAEEQLGIEVPEADVPALINYLKTTPLTITEDNAGYFIATALNLLHQSDTTLSTTAAATEVQTSDYSVDYYEEDSAALEYDQTSVEAAAQLFFVMVWGDELGIFEVIDRIAAQTSPQLQVSVRTREVSDDLALYVLDEQFRDRRSGRLSRRVPAAERHMFYRQVFGAGQSPVTDGMRINQDFPRLWATLMTEVTRYIGKLEESSNPEGLISRQKVYQAIEDLQYNLSSYCSGMAKVAAPVIHGEMDFVIRRLLNSEDIAGQLSRSGGQSFMKVVENVRGSQDFNPLRNKGVFGHQILSSVARATPALLQDETAFGELISTVEAYIVAESQLDAGDASATNDAYRNAANSGMPALPSIPGIPNIPGVPGMNGVNPGSNGKEDWNF